MSELLAKAIPGLRIARVQPNSLAEEMALQRGDLLLAIDGRPLADILDYRFRIIGSRVILSILRNDETFEVEVEKEPYETLGVEFDNELVGKIHTCNNKCVFCFIHQMPKGMRRSLYLMDDDFRLSFIYGNYVTLTNITEEEFQRILEQRLSPMYVSVHATDPDLRAKLLGKREPTPILPILSRLHDGGIDVHAQIVLCPSWNDGDALWQTLDDLASLHPTQTGKRAGTLSVAIVPVGLTRFRQKLTPLTPPNRTYAERFVHEVRSIERAFLARLGTRFAFLSDEWFFLAGHRLPGRRYYEDFPQLEDGVGTTRLFLDALGRLSRRLPPRVERPLSLTLVTSTMPSTVVHRLAQRLNAVEGLRVNVCTVENRFFGGTVSVAGLLTAQDILFALRQTPSKDIVVLPGVCLRDGKLFLDDMTVEQLAYQLGRPVWVVEPSPSALWRQIQSAIGVER